MLFGLDLREESLPADVVAQALQLYQAQEYRASMALLYRASLAYLVKNYEFSLPNGATEGDCLDLVTKNLTLPSEAEGNYFVTLTRAWQQIAYAHRNISEQEFQALCDNWSLYYSQTQAPDSRRKGADDE
ncbi:DUF4129 domain-containing protein [sulfur-oxidizing endosymbiont of Gigantopelta aegis]|uniref:DUF4129 domain-containing protein n=1 Tax=sulfur-oxidizing endosymbiont of Gigantopelta aegis TaxID=2794934 RepID=UPI001BE47327|nr:DUF4129 domain-containing protein [sulfur-oxidizing endosymbiont of Gigantopelta aegis]